jgi:hypothetical protein
VQIYRLIEETKKRGISKTAGLHESTPHQHRACIASATYRKPGRSVPERKTGIQGIALARETSLSVML